MIFIVIPVLNRWHYTHACLLSLQEQTHKNFRILVIDHGSSDSTSEKIKANFPEVIVLKGNKSMWWTAATNLGVKYALQHNAKYILTLNNDLIVKSDYLYNLLKVSQVNTPCIVGSTSVNIEDVNYVTYCGSIWNKYLAKSKSVATVFSNSYDKILDYSNPNYCIKSDMLPGRGVLIPASLFSNIGLYDEQNFPHYLADDDFSLRAKHAGYNLLVSTKSIVFSHIGDTGIRSNQLKSFKDVFLAFTSIKSPIKLKTRYRWAIKHSPIKGVYFLLDFSRIMWSILK